MSSNKQILVVDSAHGVLTGVMEELDELGFRVIWVPTLAAALEFVRASPKLALIIASAAATRTDGLTFLAEVREFAPDVRIIWGALSEGGGAASSRSGGRGPDSLIPEPFRRDALRGAITELLADHFYPPAVADAIKSAALEVLHSLGDFRVDGGAFLVANESSLAEVNAVIPFAGGIAGHVSVGMSRADAASLHEALVPGARPPRVEHLEDLVGELCNQILGRINVFFIAHDVRVHHGTPIFIRAAGSTLRYPGRQPSFGITLLRGELRVQVEYCLSEFERSALQSSPVATRVLPLGEVRYL
ncbi:MAG TPA: chemotaxis protein CheX [Polyangiaceae bacterium]